MPRMIPLPGHVVMWNTWDSDRRVTDHHTARGALIGPHGQVIRDADVVDVSEDVLAQVDAVRQKEYRTNELGTHFDPKAGAVRWVPEDEYEGYLSEEAEQADPVNRFSDAEIKAWKLDTIVSQVNTVPGLAERVLKLENDRAYTRKQVVEHCERVIDAEKGRDVSLKPADDE